MIYIPKHEEILIPLKFGTKFSGKFRLEAFKGFEFPKGSGKVCEYPHSRRQLADFDNTILNQGLDMIGARDGYMAYCHVGKSNIAESDSQTQLQTFTAGVAPLNVFTNTYWAQGTAPYYGSNKVQYRFDPGFAGGTVNLNEVGVGKTITNGNLFSRALTKDGAGTPTTITVLGDEYLDVFYTLRNYPDHVADDGSISDGTGSVTIGSTSYNYTIRAADVTASYLSRNIKTGFGVWSAPVDPQHNCMYGTDIALGAVTGRPTATEYLYQSSNETVGTYANFTYKNYITYEAALDYANFTNPAVGIKGFWLPSTLGAYQTILDAAIPKENTKILQYLQQWTWSRKAI